MGSRRELDGTRSRAARAAAKRGAVEPSRTRQPVEAPHRAFPDGLGNTAVTALITDGTTPGAQRGRGALGTVVARVVAERARVQREDGPPEPAVDTGGDVDAELDALLEQISATLPSTAEVDAWVEEIAGGPAPPRAPEVPAWEAITATTAGEYSRGELEQQIMRSWRRHRMSFTEAARQAARRDVRGRPRATQSPGSGGAEYGLRWGLNLYAADYEPGHGGDLPDVARLLRRGSPFQAALRGEFDRVVPVENPTGARISGAIEETVLNLNDQLDPGTIGQLLVSFSGHGANGRIVGVDGEVVTPMDLSDIAEFAALFRVNVVYVLDTCRAGTLVQFAQSEAMRDVEQQAEDLPEGQRGQAEEIMDQIRALGQTTFALGQRTIDVGDAAKDYRRRRTDEHTMALLDALFALSDATAETQQFLEGWSLPEGGPDAAALAGHVEELSWTVLASLSLGRRPAADALHGAATVLDESAGLLNRSIAFLTRWMGARSSAPEAGGAPD